MPYPLRLFVGLAAGVLAFAMSGPGSVALAAPAAPVLHLGLSANAAGQVATRADLYGHNMTSIDWHGTIATPQRPVRPSVLWDVAAGRPDPAWDALTHAYPLRVMRYHAGNNYAWRDVVGPIENRKPVKASEAWAPPYHPGAGLDEFLRWLETLPQRPEASLIASPFMPVADVADLIAYCNATTGPMADLRAANGHPAPYGVRHWELGNEIDWMSRADLDVMRSDTEQEKGERVSVDEYIVRCRERIAALRAVDPSVKIYAHAQTAPWPVSNPKWRAWHREVLRKLGDDIDGIVIHPYYDGYDVPYVLASIDALIADIRELQPTSRAADRPITVVVNEHARWVTPEKRDTWPQSWGLKGAISTGDFLLRLMARPEVSMANYWSYLHRGPWRVLSADWDNPDRSAIGAIRFGTAIQALYQVLNDAALPRYELLTTAPAAGEAALAATGYPHAVTAGLFSDPAGGGHALVAINRSATGSAVITLKGVPPPGGKVRRTLITADSPTATNLPQHPDAVRAVTNDILVASPAAGGDPLRFEAPPHSVVSWRWE